MAQLAHGLPTPARDSEGSCRLRQHSPEKDSQRLPAHPRQRTEALGKTHGQGWTGQSCGAPSHPSHLPPGPKPGSTADSLSDLRQAAQPLGATDSLWESEARDASDHRSARGWGRGGRGSVRARTTQCPGSDSLASLLSPKTRP